MASGLGFHCLPMSHKKDARLLWAKVNIIGEALIRLCACAGCTAPLLYNVRKQ